MLNPAKPKPLHKDKILLMASENGGFSVSCYDKEQAALRSRLRIFQMRGLVHVNRKKDHLWVKITKDTHLL